MSSDASSTPALAGDVAHGVRRVVAGRVDGFDSGRFTDAIDAVLPQTQCRQCGFDGCRPYAAAIASADAGIDRCPPGGDAGVMALARVTGRPVVPLDGRRGPPKPLARAVIDESLCIGCTLCIQACPVDAIVGGAKRMHDVVADLCTGCELCLPPCPVDCIRLVPAGVAWTDDDAASARTRHAARAARLARLSAADRSPGGRVGPAPVVTASVASEKVASETVAVGPMGSADARRRAIVEAAVARAAALPRRRASASTTADDVR